MAQAGEQQITRSEDQGRTVEVTVSRNAKTLIMIGLPAAMVISALWKQVHTPGPLSTAHTVGMVLAIVALFFWAAARLQLGSSFAIRAKAKGLVTTGIYSRIRNPVYVFGTAFMTGLILWIGQPIWLLVLCLLIPMQIMRARNEARVLEEKFGDAYRHYRATTWF